MDSLRTSDARRQQKDHFVGQHLPVDVQVAVRLEIAVVHAACLCRHRPCKRHPPAPAAEPSTRRSVCWRAGAVILSLGRGGGLSLGRRLRCPRCRVAAAGFGSGGACLLGPASPALIRAIAGEDSVFGNGLEFVRHRLQLV